jgi:hypothetical protein
VTQQNPLLEDLTPEETMVVQGGRNEDFINYSEYSEYARFGQQVGLWYLGQGFKFALPWLPSGSSSSGAGSRVMFY